MTGYCINIRNPSLMVNHRANTVLNVTAKPITRNFESLGYGFIRQVNMSSEIPTTHSKQAIVTGELRMGSELINSENDKQPSVLSSVFEYPKLAKLQDTKTEIFADVQVISEIDSREVLIDKTLTMDEVSKKSQVGSANTLSVGHAFNMNNLLYAQAIQEAAEKYDVVISIRLPSIQGQIHLKAHHPTKNFHVKAKSSNSGPTAGFIALDPFLSKRPINEHAEQARDLEKALNLGAKDVDLVLTEYQITSLIQLGSMEKTSQNEYKSIYHGEEIFFTILSNGQVYYKGGEYDGKPVKVLTNPPLKKLTEQAARELDTSTPITTDYDLFSILPKKNQADNYRPIKLGLRKIEFKMPSTPFLFKTKNYLENSNDAFKNAIQALTRDKGEVKNMDVDQGNFHTFGMTIIKAINRNAVNQGYKGGKLVWHGDEAGNPDTVGFNPKDAPVFFIPKYAPVQVCTKKELLELHKELVKLGYKPESSPLWD